jgi:pyridoxal phosphate enzyme (YggS family)
VVADPGIAARIREVEERLAAACRRAGRTREDVAVVAVTKGLGIEAVRSGRAAGMAHFGENYARELLAKRTGAPDATWHFLGRLQRNKVRRVVGSVEVIHSVEPGGAASRLADLMAEAGGGPRCLVQVDFVGHRVGVGPDGAGRFLDELRRSEDVAVVGLMTVPPLGEDPRPYFARLRGLRERLRGDHPGLRELSMGMSADYEEAVEEGATMVRIGTAIFGPRPGAVHGTAGKP